MPAAIADGYTRRVRIKGKPGYHEDFELTYRPLSGPARQALLRRVEMAGVDARPKLINEHLAAQIEEWDFTEQGEPLPVSVANCGRLEANYWTACYNVTIGLAAPDEILDGLGASATRDLDDEGADVPNC